MKTELPELSFVCVSRNDSHGGNPNKRLLYSCGSFAKQCDQYKVPAEYIIVEWNPPDDKPRLIEELRGIKSNYCKVRIITVPPSLHQKYNFSNRLPLFQMIGKNVGIRRAKSQFILSSNIDIVLSHKLFLEITKKRLKKNFLYRSTRFDVKNEILNYDFNEALAYKFVTRINLPKATLQVGSGGDIFKNYIGARTSINKEITKANLHKVRIFIKRMVNKSAKNTFPLHTNACGDFQLMSREAWFQLGGYSEMEIYSFHIDSLLMYSALRNNIYSVDFSPPSYHFHVDHSEGWLPENPKLLFDRLTSQGIGFLDEEISIFEELYRRNEIFNEYITDNWGLGEHVLEEQYI